jgi:indolepyruvate ferredoxin oxidoreductase alpha subunit
MNIKALDALVFGLIDGGCRYATNFPGFESHKLFEKLGGKQISANEKVAYEMAYGASMGGVRSVVSMKSVGLNVCADSFLASLVSGVNAGMVLVVTDDMEMQGSQTRQDSRHYLDFIGGLWFEPSSVEDAYRIGYDAFYLSESMDLPIVVRLTNQFFEIEGEIVRKEPKISTKTIVHNQEKYVVNPCYWKGQKKRLDEKIERVKKYLLEYYKDDLNNINQSGVVVAGVCDIELRELDMSKKDLLIVSAYPVPDDVLKNFLAGKTEVKVLEQGDSWMQRAVVNAISHTDISISSETGYLPEIDYRIWSETSKLFVALKEINPPCVISDVTQFTVENTGIVDYCLCMGAAIPMSIGLSEVGFEYPYCVVGDVSLIHSGIIALYEAVSRESRFGLVVVDNGGAWCTGLQKGVTDIYNLGLPIESKTVEYDNVSVQEIAETLKQMRQQNKLSILYLKINQK